MILVDTHVLLWAADDSPKLSLEARRLIEASSERWFSAINLWELAIKRSFVRARGLGDVLTDPAELRPALLANGWRELAVTGDHAIAVETLPDLHKDPFDRLLIAQANVEALTFVTSDATLAQYGGRVRKV